MIDAIINLALFILALAAAFSWGYEKGRGDAMEDELEFYEKHVKPKVEK